MSNSPPIQGPALEQARINAGLTVEEFASLARIGIGTYYNAVNQTRVLHARTTRRIADALQQIAACPRIDRVAELEAQLNDLKQQVQQIAAVQSGAVA